MLTICKDQGFKKQYSLKMEMLQLQIDVSISISVPGTSSRELIKMAQGPVLVDGS
jgi:hypothetical protein